MSINTETRTFWRSLLDAFRVLERRQFDAPWRTRRSA